MQAGGQRFDPVSLHQAHVCKSSLKKRISANARRESCGFLFFKNLEKEVKRSVNGLSAQMRRGQTETLIGTGCDCIQRVSNSIFIEREELKRTARYCHIENLDQVTKCMWWMPWRSQAKKDVVACEKLRGAGKRALIRRYPNGETH